MNVIDTGTTVTCTLCADTPRSAKEIEAMNTPRRRPIDLSDMPEADIDDTWVMPGVGNVLGMSTPTRAKVRCVVP
jgi:hypothetical protein